MSQQELALRMRLKQSAISRIERGQRRIFLLELIAVAEALRTDPIEMFRRVLGELRRR